MNDAPLFAEPVTGLRTWAVRGSPPRLTGTGRGRTVSWRLDGNWTKARCLFCDHPAPRPDCGCGLYAYHPWTKRGRLRPAGSLALSGVIEARGRVEVHLGGFRAEYARPVVLFIPPRHLLPLEQQEVVGGLASEAEGKVKLVELPHPRHAREWCVVNGFGLSTPVVRQILSEELSKPDEEELEW